MKLAKRKGLSVNQSLFVRLTEAREGGWQQGSSESGQSNEGGRILRILCDCRFERQAYVGKKVFLIRSTESARKSIGSESDCRFYSRALLAQPASSAATSESDESEREESRV